MSDYLELPSWQIEHPFGKYYAFILNSNKLLKISYVSTEDRDKGVQRPLSEKRCKDVAKFIDSSNGVLANNIILNLPQETEFISTEGNLGFLRIPDVENVAWVIDGQHRLFGFKYAHKDYELLCTGFINLNIDKQAELFITINKEQKGISTSVIYDLLPLTKSAEYKKERAHDLVKQFNEELESPWFNQIKMLGVGKGLVSQATFCQCLEKLIDANGGVLTAFPESYQFGILNNYFLAFKALFTNEWANNKFVLTKAIGLMAMCGIFPKVQKLCDKDFTVSNILNKIESLRGFDFSSASLGKSTNKIAIDGLIQELLLKLPDITEFTDIKI